MSLVILPFGVDVTIKIYYKFIILKTKLINFNIYKKIVN